MSSRLEVVRNLIGAGEKLPKKRSRSIVSNAAALFLIRRGECRMGVFLIEERDGHEFDLAGFLIAHSFLGLPSPLPSFSSSHSSSTSLLSLTMASFPIRLNLEPFAVECTNPKYLPIRGCV